MKRIKELLIEPRVSTGANCQSNLITPQPLLQMKCYIAYIYI